jgi:hypothetical protein
VVDEIGPNLTTARRRAAKSGVPTDAVSLAHPIKCCVFAAKAYLGRKQMRMLQD